MSDDSLQAFEVFCEVDMEDKPMMEVRPVVVPAQFAVVGPLAAGFFALFPGMFTFIISNIIAAVAGRDLFGGPVIVYGLVVYLLAFAGVLYLVYLKMFVEPRRTSYAVFKDRIEYDEGLLTRHRRTLVFDQVIDVHLTEGVLQQTRGAGTITLITQQLVSSGEAHLSNRQIAMRNVPEPRKIYDLVRSLAMKQGRDA